MRILSKEEARTLLGGGTVGRLGCIDNGEPYVVPINYVLEAGYVYSHSLVGRKIEALRINPRACLQVDEIQNDLNWRSVIVSGVYEEISVPDDRKLILGKLLARFPSLTPVESVMNSDPSPPESVVFRIRIDKITGVAES